MPPTPLCLLFLPPLSRPFSSHSITTTPNPSSPPDSDAPSSPPPPLLSLLVGGVKKPSSAENSRTIVELSYSGTLSTHPPPPPPPPPSSHHHNADGGWPLALGAQFVADADGSSALRLSRSLLLPAPSRASFHVQDSWSRAACGPPTALSWGLSQKLQTTSCSSRN